MSKMLDNSTWPSTLGGPSPIMDNEDDLTIYDMEDKCRIVARRPWSQPSLPFKTSMLSDGSEVPK